MKKILSILMAFMFILGLGTTVLADVDPGTLTDVDPGTLTDVSKVVMTKNYPFSNSPTTAFDFQINRFAVSGLETGSVLDDTNIPLPTFSNNTQSATLTFLPTPYTASQTLDINLPTYTEIGIYTYKITEINKTTPWVTYDSENMYLKVTVLRNTDGTFKRIAAVRFGTDNTANTAPKSGTFDNVCNTGELDVSKVVTGNFGDKNKLFTVTVTFTAPTGFPVNSVISYQFNGAGTIYKVPASLIATIQVKDGDTVKFTNIPYGMTYTVVETDYTGDGYVAAAYVYDDEAGKVIKASVANGDMSINDTVEITNAKNINVDTGISLDSIPYILLLAGTILGLGVMVLRKRQNADF